MQHNFDARTLLVGQLSFAESSFQTKRESRLRKALTEAKKSLKKKDWPTYWAYLNQAVGQAGFDDQNQEQIVTDQLDEELRGLV